MAIQPSSEIGRAMMGNMSVHASVGSDVRSGIPVMTNNQVLIGLDEKDVDKALKDYEGNPIRAPRDIKQGDDVWVELSIYDAKIVRIV